MSSLSGLPDLADLLKYLNYLKQFPDAPKNFTIPERFTNPNYVPPNNSYSVVPFSYVMMIISTIVVFSRLYVRAFIKKTLGLDDWLIIPAWATAMAAIIIEVVAVEDFGAGRHSFDIDFSKIPVASKLKYTALLLYYVTVYFTKVSIVVFLFRLFGKHSRLMRRLLIGTGIFYTMLMLTATLAYIFACSPPKAVWDIAGRINSNAKCVDFYTLMLAMACLHLAADIWLLILPIRNIWELQVSVASRIGLTVIMSFGVFACCGAVLKVAGMHGVFKSWDPSWNATLFLWGTVVEVTAGLISSSLPALSGLLARSRPRKLFSMLFSWRKRSSRRASRRLPTSDEHSLEEVKEVSNEIKVTYTTDVSSYRNKKSNEKKSQPKRDLHSFYNFSVTQPGTEDETLHGGEEDTFASADARGSTANTGTARPNPQEEYDLPQYPSAALRKPHEADLDRVSEEQYNTKSTNTSSFLHPKRQSELKNIDRFSINSEEG